MGANVFQAGLTSSKVGLQKTGELKGIEYLYSEKKAIAKNCLDADLVIGAVLNKGAKAPYVVTEEMVKSMCKGAVVVDVSIDQGGCIETSRATTHDKPIYEQYGVIHYCVANMSGAYPRTATIALCAETLIYIQQLAEKGVSAFRLQEKSAKAINIYKSRITNKQVATSLHLLESYTSINEMWALAQKNQYAYSPEIPDRPLRLQLSESITPSMSESLSY